MNNSITKKQLREFGYLIGFGFPLLIGWLLPAIEGHGFRMWTLLIGFPGLILGTAYPDLLLNPYKGWIAIGHVLGWINSYVILGLVYIIVLQPIAFAMRLFGYDPLKKKLGNELTYREIRLNHQIDLKRIF